MGLLFSLSKSDFNRLSPLHEDSPDAGNDDNTDYTADTNDTNDANASDQNSNDNNTEENTTENNQDDNADNNSDDSDNTDYTDMNFDGDDSGDDSGSDNSDDNNSSGDSSDSSGGDDNSDEKVDDIKKQEEELYNNLTPEQLDIKHKELKRNYLALYELINAIIEKISAANLSEENVSIIEFASNNLVKLKDMIIDYMENVYKTKSYIENSIIYNRYLATLTAINNMLKEMNIPTE